MPFQTRVQIIKCLVDGVGVNATCRITGAAKNTVLKLLAEVGTACAEYLDTHIRDVKSRRVQCDECWSFCYSKQANIPEEKLGQFGYGDVWTWTAIDADTKLIISHMVGNRDAGTALEFMGDVSDRLANRVQLTTDGLKQYLDAVEDVFVGEIDYAMLVKTYGSDPRGTPAGRYSPPPIVSCEAHAISGNPDPKHISTSYIERSNLTLRMLNHRFTRLTNAFSKKIQNHQHALALFVFNYNFVRIHQTLRVTPAMEAGLADHVWTVREMLEKVSEF